jgi:arginase
VLGCEDATDGRSRGTGPSATFVHALTVRIGPLLAARDTVLVLGGNCTIALAVMAGLPKLDVGVPGLLYVDRQFDLNTPVSTTDGALDWMGLAHGLSLPGCVDDLAGAFGRRPLPLPKQVAWLGVDSSLGTERERTGTQTRIARQFEQIVLYRSDRYGSVRAPCAPARSARRSRRRA